MNLHNLDLNLLPVFAALYRQRNVSRAANEVGLTQSAMSNALSRLRIRCDDPLFVRTSRGMVPTALADMLAGPVLEALQTLETGFSQPFDFNAETSDRTFSLLMSDIGESVVLPKLIHALDMTAPNIKIHAIRLSHSEYTQAMENGTADLAVGNLDFLRAGYYQQRLFSDSYSCIVRANHPTIKSELTLAQYLAGNHVFVRTGNTEPLVDSALSELRCRRNIRLEVAQYHIAVKVVAKTDLIVSVPQNAAVGFSNLRIFPLPFAMPKAEVRQFWHERNHHDPANQWLRKAVVAAIRTDLA